MYFTDLPENQRKGFFSIGVTERDDETCNNIIPKYLSTEHQKLLEDPINYNLNEYEYNGKYMSLTNQNEDCEFGAIKHNGKCILPYNCKKGGAYEKYRIRPGYLSTDYIFNGKTKKFTTYYGDREFISDKNPSEEDILFE